MVARDVRERKKFEGMSEADRLEHIRNRLTHNLEVLRGLEEEFTKEAMSREDLNKQLEGEGYTTLQEKLDALKKKFAEKSGVNIDEMQTNLEEFVKTQQEALDNKSGSGIIEPVLNEDEVASEEAVESSEEVDERATTLPTD